ncbi:MAG TPA: glucosaminidase domain-containing protein [Bacteroidales bacterium]
MLYRIYLFFLTVLSLGLFSCSVNKQVVSSTGSGLTAGEYINTYKDLAVSEMKRTGIPASITLAQGMIESDFGRSRLARESNNHFGIKCHSDWTGTTIRHNDDRRNECFRKYSKAEESFYDHSDFLKSESRYRFLFDIDPTEYKVWARGLKKAGYATNPDYANMLIRKIEENNLWYFDQGYNSTSLPPQTTVPVKESLPVQAIESTTEKPVSSVNGYTSVQARVPRIMDNNRIQYIIVKDGDTKEKLNNEFQLLKWELARYNELASDFELVPGEILYLQPKRERAEPGKDFYTTIEGDTMYLICQRYGIKLNNLYEMNRMEPGFQPEAGKKLWLRTMKPVN